MFSYKSRFILNIETNEILESPFKAVLKKMTSSGPIYVYDIDDIAPNNYIKAINLKRGPLFEVGKTYRFNPRQELIDYKKSWNFVHRTIREAINNVPDANVFYLVSPSNIFHIEDGKYFCDSFTVLERVEINPHNLFHKLRTPVDLLFKLSLRFTNLINPIKYYLIKFNKEWNLDFILEYTRYYDNDAMEILYNEAIEKNKFPSYPGPLEFIPIKSPDSIERRVAYIKDLITSQYKNTSSPYYDFGDFIIRYFSKINVVPYFLQDYIIGDEDNVIEYVKTFHDKSIKDNRINKNFVNPYIWIRELESDKSEMLNRLLNSPMNIDTFHSILCYLKDFGPNQELISKALSGYVPPAHLIKLLVTGCSEYETIFERCFNPINLRQHAAYMLDPNYENVSGIVYDYQTIAALISNFEQITYPEYYYVVYRDGVYYTYETKFTFPLQSVNSRYLKEANDRPDSDRRYYETLSKVLNLPDIDDISIYDNPRPLFCKAGVLYYWVSRLPNDAQNRKIIEALIKCKDYNTKFKALYVSSFQEVLRGSTVERIYRSIPDECPVSLYYWEKYVKTHTDEIYDRIIKNISMIPTDELKYEIASFYNKDLDLWKNSIHDPYLRYKLEFSSTR